MYDVIGKDIVEMNDEARMRATAHELCKKIQPNSIHGIKERNERIITILMDKFGISRERAEEVFMNNNSSV